MFCRGVWHLHPTTLNEAVDVSGKQDLVSLVYLHNNGRHGHLIMLLVAISMTRPSQNLVSINTSVQRMEPSQKPGVEEYKQSCNGNQAKPV